MKTMGVQNLNTGRIISVRSSVVDACFPHALPAIRNILRTEGGREVVVEVTAHLSSEVVRGIALTPTQGLALGTPVIDTGLPLHVPVGRELPGRMFNVFGDVIDRGEELLSPERRSARYMDLPPLSSGRPRFPRCSKRESRPSIFWLPLSAAEKRVFSMRQERSEKHEKPMRLRVLLPTTVLIDEEVKKVIAEAQNGSFCLLPRHIDFVAALVPGLLSFERAGGGEEFLAVDEGILVKCGSDVRVSTRNAVRGPDLGTLKKAVDEQFRTLDEGQKIMRGAIARLESNLIRRFMELK